MYLSKPPQELKFLNPYELILIQLSKCFQTFVSLQVQYSRFFKGVPALKGITLAIY